MARRGDVLLADVAASGSEEAAHELLDEFFSGYPVEKLRELLSSDDEQVVKAGAWIASELGERAAPVLPEIGVLLKHPLTYVRFFALDCVLAATEASREVIADAISLIADSDPAVRWKAMHFLAKAGQDQLEKGAGHIRDSVVAAQIDWLIAVENASDDRPIMSMLNNDARLQRLIAAVAARRAASQDALALEYAAASADPEVRSFAEEELESLGKPRRPPPSG